MELQLMIYTGYPMYFKLNGKDSGSNGQFATGISEVTVAVEKALEVGDVLYFHKDKHVVSEVLETRKPKGIGHPEHIVFQHVRCDYARLIKLNS